MKFPLLVLFASGALSAPFFDASYNAYFFEDDCSDPRLRDDGTSIYRYEGETVNTVQGSTSESTGLKLTARVYIHSLGACKYRMQINNPELLVKSKNQVFQTAPESAKFSRELRAQDLIFQTAKGRINKLFPAEGEALHILNIKRGILSTLQLQTDATEEVDVNGKCNVVFTKKNGVVVKTKDLTECSDRALNEIGLQTANFAHSKMPVKPLSSKSICHYETKFEKIISVQCDESHIFRPFSAGYTKTAGAITTVKQVMKLEEVKGRAFYPVETTTSAPVTLMYGHEDEIMKPDNSIIKRIDTVMTSLVKNGHLSAKQSSAHGFVQLVNLIRKLDNKRMTPVIEKYFNFASSDDNVKSAYRQFILDALTYCGTPTCVTTVHDVIISGDVSGEYRNMFLQGISLVAKPTKQMIRDVHNIALNKPSRQAYLALGVLIQRYCKADASNCVYSKTNPVTLAEIFLEDKLGQECEGQDDHERVEDMLMAIKAIGNAGQPSRATSVLLKCAKTAQHMNITTAALDALRRMPCNEDIQSTLHDMLEDIDFDAERRIQTYLALMNCPSKETLTRITNQLDNEKSNQVGSFIASHLKNILESSDPKHSETQKVLTKLFDGKDFSKFDLTFTKFSKAFEGSMYSKYLKSGATVNGHLIYNTDSFIPKSSLVSMSANILDVPVEVFEMAARIDGVESIIEDFFGQYGYFPDEAVMNFFNSQFSNEKLETLRARRSVDVNYENTVNEMHKTVNKRKQPSGSLTMKVLGQEMRVFSLDDLQWAADEIDNMNVIELLLKVAKGGHKTFTKSIMFLEVTHTVPTGLGLPLKLKLTGSAVGSLELDGKFDIRNMFWGPMALEVKGSVKPSTVVEVSGQMGVHSHYVETGMFVNSSMFTSQVVKGSVIYREGQQLKINIDAPEKPIEFFNISSTPFMFVNEDIKLIDGAPRKLSPDFCLNSKMVLGLGLCTRISVPVAFRDYEAPYFPLSGPASFGLKLVKADPKLTTYQFLVSLSKKTLSPGKELIGTFEVGTPGATYSRGVSGSIKYKETGNVRELTIGTSEAKSNTELKISYQNNTNRFEVAFDTNVISSKPISMKFLFFNETSFLSKETGILTTASYDWYKFQHVSKYVRKLSSTKSLLLHTRTTYWPGKYITAEAEYTPGEKKVSLRFDANQFNQRVEMDGKIVTTETEKGIDFTATHISTNKKISFYTGMTNTDNAKNLVFNVKTMTSKPVELSIGYYVNMKRQEIRFDANILGKYGKLFVDYSNLRSGWHGVNVGGMFEDYNVGLSSSYNNEAYLTKEACIVAYFNDKRPGKTCLSLKDDQLTWSVEVLKKTAAVTFGVTTSADKYTLTSIVTVEEKDVLKNQIEMTYNSIMDNELKMTTTAGQKSVMTRFFATKESDSVSLFGVEGKGFGQFVKLQATYSTASKDDASVYGVIFQGWVNKKLPISYTVLVETSEKMNGIKSVLKIMDYTSTRAVFFGTAKQSEYVLVTEMSMEKKDLVMFGMKTTDILEWEEKAKIYKSTLEMTVMNKKFKYGFDLGFENKSSGTKCRYAITFGVDYAQNRRSAVTATFANSESLTELFIDFNYMPGKLVQHVFKYNKYSKKIDATVEFLPKMYIKLAGQLNNVEGWKLNTDLTMSWSNFETTLKSVAAYVNKANLKGLNFQLNGFKQQLFVSSEYNTATKTLTFAASAFGQKARFSISFDWSLGLGRLLLSMQKVEGNTLVMKDIMETLIKFSKKGLFYEWKAGGESIFKVTGNLDKTYGSLALSVMGKSIGKLYGNYAKEKKTFNINMVVLGNEIFKMNGMYNDAKNTVLLGFNFMNKVKDVVFIGKWNTERKEVVVGLEFMGKKVGIKARFDPTNYAVGMSCFYQENMIGWSMMYFKDTSSIVYKVTLSPKMSVQAVLQLIADHIVSLSLQRQTNAGFINELTLKYELSSATSSFILEWNKGTVKKVKDMIVPYATNTAKEIAQLLKKTIALGQSVSMDTLNNLGGKVLDIIDAADKKFDEFDFVAARDKLGAMTVDAVTNAAKLAQKGMKLSSKTLMMIHDNMPMMVEKANMYFAKAVVMSKSSIEEATKLAKVTYGALKSITEAGVPVAKLAFKLAKEFKIRGKTTEEIVMNLVKMAEKLVKSYNENLTKQIKKMTEDVKNYIATVKIPFTEMKAMEVLKEYIAKLKSINFEEKARAVTRMVLQYELMGKTIKSYADEIRKTLNNLPMETKKLAISVIKQSRKGLKKLETLRAPFEPLIQCLKKIMASVKKHFGPLANNAVKKMEATLKAQFIKVYTPLRENALKAMKIIEEFMKPLMKPLMPLYEDLKLQIRAIKLLEQGIGEVFDAYVDILKTKATTKYNELYATAMQSWGLVKQTSMMTMEEIAIKTIDTVTAAATILKIYAQFGIANRMTLYGDIKAAMLAQWAQVEGAYNFLTSKPVEDLFKMVIGHLAQYPVTLLKETSKVLDQIAEVDVATPIKRAWTEMDLLNHLGSYGLNGQLTKLIEAMKKIDAKEALVQGINDAKAKSIKAYETVYETTKKSYEMTMKAFNYVKSIPKKDFDAWYAEVETVVMESSKVLSKSMKKLYNTMTTTYNKVEANVIELYNTYDGPVIDAYKLVKSRAVMVYDDVKTDCAITYDIYKAIVMGVTEEKYQEVKKAVEKAYMNVYEKAAAFYLKYESKTWEEIGSIVYTAGKKKYDAVYTVAIEKYEMARVMADNALAKAAEWQRKINAYTKETYGKVEKLYMEKIKPEVVKLYKKTIAYINTKSAELKTKVLETYDKLNTEVMRVYGENKYLSIRELSVKAKKLVVKIVKEYIEKVKVAAKENFNKVYSKVIQLKNMFVANVLPVMKQESVSIINQSLKASVILAEETVKAFKPHYLVAKKYTEEYTKKAVAMAKEYYSKAIVFGEQYLENMRGMSLKTYEKGMTIVKREYKRVAKYLTEVMEKIKENPRYQQLIKTEAFVKLEKFIKWMKQMVEKKVEELKTKIIELKNHPKIAEMKAKLEEFKNHKLMKMMVKTLKQVQTSSMYSYEMIKGKVQPHLTLYRTKIEMVPGVFVAVIKSFRNDPVECFWSNVEKMKNVISMVLEYNWKELKTTAPKAVQEFLEDVTDEETKKAYNLLVTKGKELYNEYYGYFVALPAKIKTESQRIYKQQMELLKMQYAKIVEQWKDSPLYPIFTHQVWSEIADEIIKHELTVELKNLASISLEMFQEIYVKASTDMKAYVNEVKAKLMTKYNEMMEIVNNWLDITTLEDIVLQLQDMYIKTTSKAMKAMVEMTKAANEKATEYASKVMMIAKKQYMKAKGYFDEEYPKIVMQAKQIYADNMKLSKEYYEKLVSKVMVFRQTAMTKAVEMWEVSSIKAKLDDAKKMTVGETYAMLMKFPQDARKTYQSAKEMALAKYNTFVQPYLSTAINGAKFVGNEINETLVFIVRYYHLEDNIKQLYTQGFNQIKTLLPKMPVAAKQFMKDASKTSLKAVHSALVFADQIDFSKVKATYENIMKTLPLITKYANVNMIESGVELKIVHPFEVEPSFKYHVSNAEKTVMTYAEKVSKKSLQMTRALLEELKTRTAELRKDLNQSYGAHVELGKHVQSRLPVYKLKAMKTHATAKKMLAEMYDTTKLMIGNIAKDGKKTAIGVYDFTKMATSEILQAQSIPNAYELAKSHAQKALKKIQKYFSPLMTMTEDIISKAQVTGKKLVDKMWNKMKPYYVLAKENGFNAVYYEIQTDLKVVYKTAMKEVQTVATIAKKHLSTILDPEDAEVLGKYGDVHTGILSRYAKRLYKLYKWNKISLDRAIRRSKMNFLYRIFNPLTRKLNPFRTYAMIFGKHHVITFDGKYFEFPKYAQPNCAYLIARDFKTGKFTIYSQKETIIVETPDAKVSIDKYGKVNGAIKTTKAGVTWSEKVSGVPIETEALTCKRWSHFIKCEFKQGVTIRCNAKHYLCTVELSASLFGKTQGILGTNNREIYDEFKMVNNKITTSVEQFANSWLVTKSSECIVKESNNEAPACNKAPSERCIELFKSKSSPLAKYFSQVDPIPFLKTCQIDTADCKDTISYCDSVAAYLALLKMGGVAARNIKDCHWKNTDKPWTVKQKKDVDVVVVMSARSEAREYKKIVASMLYNMNKKITSQGITTRYALISYGAAVKGTYGARSHTFDGKYFSTENEVATEIKQMDYTGKKTDTNDYYQAIMSAAKQPFKAEAMRIIILFNFDKYIPTWYGPTSDETEFTLKYEANASLFVFDNFNFEEFQNGMFKAIGMTNKKLYMTPSLKVFPLKKSMPHTPFTKFVRKSGGLFMNKITKKTEKIFTGVLSDAVNNILKEGVHLCKTCKQSKYGVQCRTDRTAKC